MPFHVSVYFDGLSYPDGKTSKSWRGMDLSDASHAIPPRVRLTVGPLVKEPWRRQTIEFESANQNRSLAPDCMERGFGWDLSSKWLIPADWPSDLYVAWLTLLDVERRSVDTFNIPFIVRPALEAKAGPTPVGARPFLPSDPDLHIRSPIVPRGDAPSRLDRLYGPPPERLRPAQAKPDRVAFALQPRVFTRSGKTRRILYCFPTSTWLAYSGWSPYRNDQAPQDEHAETIFQGALYDGAGRSRKVSFDRFLRIRDINQLGDYAKILNEDPAVDDWLKASVVNARDVLLAKYLDELGLDYDACGSVDLHAEPDLLDDYGLILFGGHDEYWSREMRDHLETFVTRGGNAVVLSGNTCWWQVHFDPAPDGTPDRVMVCAKTPYEDPIIGVADPKAPSDPRRATVEWAALPASRPENLTLGLSYRYGGQSGPTRGFTLLRGLKTPWASKFLAGTGLDAGKLLGAATGIVGYETDGVAAGMGPPSPFLLVASAASVTLTHADGTPRFTYPLGYADLDDWRGYDMTGEGHQAGNGMMMFFRRGNGMVFHGGATEWSPALYSHRLSGKADNVDVRRFVANVLEVFATTNASELFVPAEFKYDDPMAAPSGGLTWADVPSSGLPPGRRLVAIGGHVEGHLFATDSDGRLYRREPLPSASPWTEAELPAGSPRMDVLGSDLIGQGALLGGSGGRLYRRQPRVTLAEWQEIFVTPDAVRGIGVPRVNRYVLAGDYLCRLSFERKSSSYGGGDEQPRGARIAPAGGARLLTAVDRSLVGVRGDDVVLREAIDVDVRWRTICAAPRETVAIANCYGVLYALAANGDLRWRASAATTEESGLPRFVAVHPGYVLAYQADPLGAFGRCGLYAFHPNGDVRLEARFEDRTDIPPNCTHLIGCGDDAHALFVGKGPLQVARVTAFAGRIDLVGTPVSFSVPSPDAQWTHAVAIGRGRILLYSRRAGEAKVVGIDSVGKVSLLAILTGLPKDARSVVVTESFELAIHAAGVLYTGVWDETKATLSLAPGSTLADTHTHAAAIGHGKILFVDPVARTASVLRLVAGKASLTGVTAFASRFLPRSGLQHLVGGVNGLVMAVASPTADEPMEVATAGVTDDGTELVYHHIRYLVAGWFASASGAWTALGVA